MTHERTSENSDDQQIRELVELWARAVRDRDIERILLRHSPDMVMYDVSKPFQSIGIDAYRQTWQTFFAGTKPGIFYPEPLSVMADDSVAFCFGTGRCETKSNDVYTELEFRLTIGLQKLNGQWTIVHEHHSIPAE